MTRKHLQQLPHSEWSRTSVTAGDFVAAVPLWKSIEIGSYESIAALRHALRTARCGLGNWASEALSQPAFSLARARGQVDLAVISAGGVGFEAKGAWLPAFYARAAQLGLELCPAEVAPQLRLQYPDQPVGEFLRIAMRPIPTTDGRNVVLIVGNGGAGLLLIGAEARPDSPVPLASPFVFLRSPLAAGPDLDHLNPLH